jgi:hypothetical protein
MSSLCLIEHHAAKTYCREEISYKTFLTLELASDSRFSHFSPGEKPLYPLDRRLAGPEAGLDMDEEKKSLPLARIESVSFSP